ncbi:hypothetical protein LTS18_001387, partial [Coniosporium uncinatum]
MSESGSQDTDSAALLTMRTQLHTFVVLSEGKVVVAATRDTVLIGIQEHKSAVFLKDVRFIWRELRSNDPITCIEARERPRTGLNKDTKGKSRIIDLVIGLIRGEMIIYEDVLYKLIAAEQPKKANAADTAFSPRKLHWHREAVSTIKWSLDGNYLISGGRETVLVLWQLATGKKQ